MDSALPGDGLGDGILANLGCHRNAGDDVPNDRKAQYAAERHTHEVLDSASRWRCNETREGIDRE